MIAPGSQLPSVTRPGRRVVLVEPLRDGVTNLRTSPRVPLADEVDRGRDRHANQLHAEMMQPDRANAEVRS